MKRWALISGGAVTAVVEQDTMPTIGGEWRDITGVVAGPGFVISGNSLVPPAPQTYTRIRTDAFWDRFSSAELVRYDVAMQHDPAASDDAKKEAAKLRIFKADADQTGYRRIASNKVTSLVNALEPGILSAGRAADILNAPITAAEAYLGSEA